LIIDTAAMLELQSVKILPWERPEVPDVALTLSRHALELILSELFENARKFHPTHSPQIDIKMVVRETTLKLLIGDDGLTLTPEQLTRIWTPYYQAEKYFTGQVAGTGLGLAMVAAMIWEVNGVCQAYNQSDRPGLIIDLTIPFRNQADADG
jgi:K+-sensing histidine kinase KdpD